MCCYPFNRHTRCNNGYLLGNSASAIMLYDAAACMNHRAWNGYWPAGRSDGCGSSADVGIVDLHNEGANFAFFDGHVKWLRKEAAESNQEYWTYPTN